MKFRNIVLLLTVTLFSLSGCYVNRSFVSFEILEPAKFTYPENVERIAYLNRSPFSTSNITLLVGSAINRNSVDALSLYDLFIADSARDEGIRESLRDSSITRENVLYILDTLVNTNLLYGFVEAIQTASGMQSYMDSLLYIDARFAHDSLYKSSPLNQELKEELCRAYNLDALVTQDSYSIVQGHNGTNVTGTSVNELVVYGTVEWGLYLRNGMFPVNETETRESFYYPYKKETERPTFEEALRDGVRNFGFVYGMNHVPEWVTTTRTVYSGPGKDLSEAAKYTGTYNWDKAVEIWTVLLNNRNRQVAAKARHNLAVYNEMNDNIEMAMEYLKQEGDIRSSKINSNYLEMLEKRKSKVYVINVQVR